MLDLVAGRSADVGLELSARSDLKHFNELTCLVPSFDA
jgi:hypothetical protein